MNANELAEWLENHVCGRETTKEVIAMLRQQQAEIERLSNDNYKFIQAMAKKDSHIESLKQLLNDSVLRKAQEK